MTYKKTILIIALFTFWMHATFGQLHGTYTIGKNGTEDYSSISSAVNYIVNNGISSTVIFKISAGEYNEQLYLPYVFGSEMYSPVIFESADGDSTSVVIHFKPDTNSIPYTIALETAKHVIFQNLTITTDTLIGIPVQLGRECYNIKFKNCRFLGIEEGKALVNAPCLDGNINEYVFFENNYFQGGSHGLDLCQGGVSPDYNTYIENNVFSNQKVSALRLKNHAAPLISGNTIINSIHASSFYAIFLDNCSGASRILSNKIFLSNIGINSFGIRIFKSDGMIGNEVLVANNFIYEQSNEWCAGINITASDFVNVYFNSIHLTGNSTGSACFSNIIGAHTVLKNNNFVNTAQGYTLLLTSANNLVCDYNNHYVNGLLLGDQDGSGITDLNDWKSTSQQATHSISVFPSFCKDSNLHTFTDSLNNAGISIQGISSDIDGENRNNPPDIGADEFSPFSYSIGPDVSACANDSIVLDAGKFDDYLWESGTKTRYLTVKADSNSHQEKELKIHVNYHGCWFTDTINAAFFPNPVFDLADDTTFCLNTFSSHTIHGPEGYNDYLWHDMTKNNYFTLSKPGDTGIVKVFLMVTDSNSCAGSDTGYYHFIHCVGTEEYDPLKISIGPNPFSEKIQVVFDTPQNEQFSLQLYDLNGKILKSVQLQKNSSYIDVRNLREGVYILHLYSNNKLISTQKIQKK
jgi:hypothetical protein